MSAFTVSLCENAPKTILDESSASVEFDCDWSITHHVLQQGVSQGVQVLELSNGPLKVWVLPTRGMGVWKAEYKGQPIGWNSPVKQPVNPMFVNLQSRNGLGWLDGFNELICRCGLSSNGPPGHDESVGSPIESELTLHGKIANLPAHSVQVFASNENGGMLGVSGIVDESTLFGPQLQLKTTIWIAPHGNTIHLEDEITNFGSSPTELELLYHTNLGPPFLEEGAQVHCPARLVVPRDMRAGEGVRDYPTYLAPTEGYAEQVYYFELMADEDDQTLALLNNQAGDLGVSLHFNQSQLPCFALWKCTQSKEAGYVTGLEPGTNFPNFKAFERHHQRVVQLEGNETYRTGLQLEVHFSKDEVQEMQQKVQQLQQSTTPKVFSHPTSPFCPID